MPIQAPPWLQHGVIDPAIPSLEVGLATGCLGATTGGIIGLFHSSTPVVLAATIGTQAFYYGTTTFWIRGALIGTVFKERTKRTDLVASGFAGAISGAGAGAFTGSLRNIIRSSFLIGALGIGSQSVYHAATNFYDPDRPKKSILDRIAGSRWVPMRSLSNEQYESILNTKINKLDAEIAMIDDEINALKTQKSSQSTGDG